MYKKNELQFLNMQFNASFKLNQQLFLEEYSKFRTEMIEQKFQKNITQLCIIIFSSVSYACLQYQNKFMVFLILLFIALLGFIFRKKIQRWLDTLEGPIGRLRGNRNPDNDRYSNNNNGFVIPQSANFQVINNQYPQPNQNIPNFQNYYYPPNQNYNYVPNQAPVVQSVPLQRSQVNDVTNAYRQDVQLGVNPYIR